MPRHDFSDVKLYAYHEPENLPLKELPRPDSEHEGAGTIHYGVVLDGVELQLGVVKAGRYLRNLQRHKQAQEEA